MERQIVKIEMAEDAFERITLINGIYYVQFGRRRVVHPEHETEDGTVYPEPVSLICSRVMWGFDEPTEEELLAFLRPLTAAEIRSYDASEAVNSFSVNGQRSWFDKAERTTMRDTMRILQEQGETESTLWLGTTRLVLPVAQVYSLLCMLERYALESFNVTASKLAAVESAASLDELLGIDIGEGYPERLEVTL